MTRDRAEEILDAFIFRNIENHYNCFEETHDITFVGNHFAVRERETGIIHTFKVEFKPSDLPANDWIQAFDDQEWFEEEEM